MGEVLLTNIFFFITASGVIILTIFLSIIFYHVIRAIQCVRRIIERVESGSEVLVEDLQHVRSVVKNTSSMMSTLLGFKAIIRDERRETPKTKKKGTKLSIIDES
jgi:hypothetical protein